MQEQNSPEDAAPSAAKTDYRPRELTAADRRVCLEQ